MRPRLRRQSPSAARNATMSAPIPCGFKPLVLSVTFTLAVVSTAAAHPDNSNCGERKIVPELRGVAPRSVVWRRNLGSFPEQRYNVAENLSPPPPPAGPLPIPYPIQGGKSTEAARPPGPGLLEDGSTATPPSSVRGRIAKDPNNETSARPGGLNRPVQAK
jgi:hypothetical protein